MMTRRVGSKHACSPRRNIFPSLRGRQLFATPDDLYCRFGFAALSYGRPITAEGGLPASLWADSRTFERHILHTYVFFHVRGAAA